MPAPPRKLTKLEMRIMETLWSQGPLPIRDIQEAFPSKGRPAYSTIQTMVYRLETKKAVRRTRKVGNAHIFEAVLSRDTARHKWIDDLLSLFGGRIAPVMAYLAQSGKLTLADIREAEALLEKERKP